MNKQTLVEILEKGVSNAGKLGSDTHQLVFEGDFAVCKRRWDYDDMDMNDDNGWSSAQIPKKEVEVFLDEVIASGKGERIFSSVNSLHSYARYSEGGHEDIEEGNYHGQVKISLALENEKVAYMFLPGISQTPSIRLQKGRDYL